VPAAWATWIQADELQYFGEGPLPALLSHCARRPRVRTVCP